MAVGSRSCTATRSGQGFRNDPCLLQAGPLLYKKGWLLPPLKVGATRGSEDRRIGGGEGWGPLGSGVPSPWGRGR